jgi:hypothetical protein
MINAIRRQIRLPNLSAIFPVEKHPKIIPKK